MEPCAADGRPIADLELRHARLLDAFRDLEASEARYRTAFDASPVGISLSDEQGHFVVVNAALCELFGRPESDILGRSAAEFTHPGDQALQSRLGEMIDAAADGRVRVEKRYLRPDGEVRWGWLTLAHTLGPDGQTWTVAHMQDTTERKVAEQALIDSEANLTAVTRVIHRIQSGADARETIVAAGAEIANAQTVCLLEPSADHPHSLQVTASHDPDRIGQLVSTAEASAVAHVYRSGRAVFLADLADDDLTQLARLTGTSHGGSVYLAPVSTHDRVSGILIVGWDNSLCDLDDRRAQAVTLLAAETGVALRQSSLVAELAALARTDPLTRLMNRRGWDERLAELLEAAARTGTSITVALADLDHFKCFNDTFGHHAGDRLLAEFGRRGPLALRQRDIMARWGGEEFAIALPDCDERQAAAVLNRLRRAVTDQQSCSIGFATWDRSESADELLARVDGALYAAKRAGRNTVVAATADEGDTDIRSAS